MHRPLTPLEVFGLTPLRARLAQAWLTLRGDDSTPPSRFDHTSLKQLVRLPGPRVWAGQRIYDRRVPILNLFNYTPPPPEQGWSVRITRVRDFRGGALTYDSHNGTDLVVPVGTVVVAAAPGRVGRVSSEFHRGGLKVFLDHGAGLVTSYNHLGRALVQVGDRVGRGEPIALSGYSGLDGLATFPWGVPHVHFNVWLDGEYVDPFAPDGEVPLWVDDEGRATNAPAPFRGTDAEVAAEPLPDGGWDHAAVEATVEACRSAESRADLERAPSEHARAVWTLFHSRYFPTRFSERPPLYREAHPRGPRLSLPFRARDYDGVHLPE